MGNPTYAAYATKKGVANAGMAYVLGPDCGWFVLVESSCHLQWILEKN